MNATDTKITTSTDIQVAYVKFYSKMMNYLWDINTVMNLAHLEIAIYKRFPSKDEMEKYIELIGSDIRDTLRDSDNPESSDFKKAYDLLKSKIESFDDNSGCDIYSVTSNSDIPDIEESEETEEVDEVEEPKKKKIKIADISIKSAEAEE